MSESPLHAAGYSVKKKTLTIDPETGDLTVETFMSPSSSEGSRRASTTSSVHRASISSQDLIGLDSLLVRGSRRASSSSTRHVSSSSESSSSSSRSSSNRMFRIRGGSPATQFLLLKRLLSQLQLIHLRRSNQF